MFRFNAQTGRSLHIPATSGAVNVQRVRLWSMPRSRLIGFILAPMIIYAALPLTVVFLPADVQKSIETFEKDLDKRIELRKPKGGTKHAESYAAKDSAIFIPLPWIREVPQPLYQKTDPEWKEFLKLEQDTERVEKLKHQASTAATKLALDSLRESTLMSLARGAAVKPGAKERKVQVAVEVMLELVFPYRPPPALERPGLLITPDGLSWTSKRMSEKTGRLYERIARPKVHASAIWAGCKAYGKFQYNAITSWVFSTGRTKAQTSTNQQAGLPAGSSPNHTEGHAIDERISKAHKAAHAISSSTSPSNPQDKLDPMQFMRDLIASPTADSAIAGAVKAYKREFVRRQIRAWQVLGRGNCWFEGALLIHGGQAKLWVHTKWIYDPATDRFIGPPELLSMVVMPRMAARSTDVPSKPFAIQEPAAPKDRPVAVASDQEDAAK